MLSIQLCAKRIVEEVRVLGSSSLDAGPCTSFATKVDAKATLHRLDFALDRSFDWLHAIAGRMRRLEQCIPRHERGGRCLDGL